MPPENSPSPNVPSLFDEERLTTAIVETMQALSYCKRALVQSISGTIVSRSVVFGFSHLYAHELIEQLRDFAFGENSLSPLLREMTLKNITKIAGKMAAEGGPFNRPGKMFTHEDAEKEIKNLVDSEIINHIYLGLALAENPEGLLGLDNLEFEKVQSSFKLGAAHIKKTRAKTETPPPPKTQPQKRTL